MGIKKEGMCGEVVIVVRIEFRIAGELTAVLVLELETTLLAVWYYAVVVIMLVPVLVLVPVEMDVVVGRFHG